MSARHRFTNAVHMQAVLTLTVAIHASALMDIRVMVGSVMVRKCVANDSIFAGNLRILLEIAMLLTPP